MGKYINFGIFNKHYKYILLYIILKLFNNSLEGMNYYTAFNPLKLLDNEPFSKFELVRDIFCCYFGTFIFSIIFYVCEIKKFKKETKKSVPNEKSKFSNNEINLIHEKYKDKRLYNFPIYTFIFVMFCWALEEQIIEKYSSTLSHLDFWMFELIIICILNAKMFHTEIYKHHKFVLYFSLIPILFKIITIFLTFSDKNSNVIYVEKWYWIPLGLIIYFPLITLKAYVIIKLKFFMDFNYISANKLLILYGFIGTIIFSIICMISTFTDINNSYIFLDKNSSFCEYFKINATAKIGQIISEIILIILGMIISYFINYNFMMIIKFLTPVYIVFLTPIFYFFFKLVLIIYNIFYCLICQDFSGFFNTNGMSHLKEKFILDSLGDIFSFLGFLVYLEIIELNCYGLNYNLRNNIITRAWTDSSITNFNIYDDIDEESSEGNSSGRNTNESMGSLVDINI